MVACASCMRVSIPPTTIPTTSNRFHRSLWRLTDFRVAASWVSSRAFYIDRWHDMSMVPLADLFNHKVEGGGGCWLGGGSGLLHCSQAAVVEPFTCGG